MVKKELFYKILCGQFVALIALGAFIRIPLPVVPFTLQFLFVLLTGLLLGSKYGALSVLLYICLGLAGLPIFASGGGLGYIFMPTFGYLLGFLVAAFICGKIKEYYVILTFNKAVFANFIGLIAVYLFGMGYFYFISNFYTNSSIGFWALLSYCFFPAIPGDIALCFFGAYLFIKIEPIIKKYI